LEKDEWMNSPEIQQFIKEYSYLFWYTPEEKKPDISHEFLVETILNYGDMEAVIKLFNLLGIKTVADIFFTSINLSERRRGNYHELIINFFTLVFNKYAY
jgi:hypothetical protein